MKSFSLLRTNTGLSTNVKVMVDSFYNLFLESIDTNPRLSSDRFKKFQFNKDNYYDELVPYFFKDFPVDLAFDIKYDGDISSWGYDFSKQYDDTYQMGARNITDNKNYEEEYEFFAPLYVFKQSIPEGFFIFRADGPGLTTLTKENFRTEVLNKMKCVKFFDLTTKTVLGEWINKNFTENIDFPRTGFYLDFRKLQFSTWNGINYENGGYTQKPFFLDETLEIENALHDLEKFVFDGFKQNKVIFPHIINFSFLFDDTPATPDSIRSWSMNRYYGFYIDQLDLIEYITPFSSKPLYSDVTISTGNVLSSASYSVPFVGGYNPEIDYWVELDGKMYRVKPFEEETTKIFTKTKNSKNVFTEEFKQTKETKYRIISDIDFTGRQADLNQNICHIDSGNYLIKYIDGSYFDIIEFELADFWVIDINGKYHRLIKDSNGIKLITDYAFNFVPDVKFEYWINSPDPSYKTTLDIKIEKNAVPFSFKIYRLNFTDIKDFDTQIADNKFAQFEYELPNDLTITDEPKLYTTDLRSKTHPKALNDYIWKDKVVHIPVASDYTANLETFRINKKELSDLWRKNVTSLRWGYQNSISNADYPYLMNNSLLHGDYNRTSNTHDFSPIRPERNLDHFYSINSGTTSYLYQSLNIDNNIGSSQATNYFNRDYYLNNCTFSITGYDAYTYSYDYFQLFFGATESFNNGGIVNNVEKWSLFESGDTSIPNITNFRGIKFKLYDVDNIKVNQGYIESVNLTSNNNYEDYKFSILLSKDKIVPNFCTFSIIAKAGGSYYSSSGLLKLKMEDPKDTCIVEGISIIRLDLPAYHGLAKVVGINGTTMTICTPGNNPIYYGGPSVALTFTASEAIISTIPNNEITWQIIDPFQHDNHYLLGDLVMYQDIVYESNIENIISDPNEFPVNSASYSLWGITYSVFWNPKRKFYDGDVVFRQGDWWKYKNIAGQVNFWDPSFTYSTTYSVISYGQVWKPEVSTFNQEPSVNIYEEYTYTASNISYTAPYGAWTASSATDSNWTKIPMWNPSILYDGTPLDKTFVVHNDIVWFGNSTISVGEEPTTNSNYWFKKYSFVPEENVIYGTASNPILTINNKYYYVLQNGLISDSEGNPWRVSPSYLDNGIIIYVNHKHKNVLVDILINDNTTLDIFGVGRDALYNELNSRLTAANIMQSINDLHTKYGFLKYVKYVIVDQDGTYATYSMSDGITGLPSMLIAEDPDHLQVQHNSMAVLPVNLEESKIAPIKVLKNGVINNQTEINYYNRIPLGSEFKRLEDRARIVPNYHGQENIIYDNLFRHSGYYMPLVYTIDLFQTYFVKVVPGRVEITPAHFDINLKVIVPGRTTQYLGTFSSNLNGNYVFDTDLKNFGMIKQRISSKVNRKGAQFKLKNDPHNMPIYPMLDEFGYGINDFFIFKSTWDFEYLYECLKNNT